MHNKGSEEMDKDERRLILAKNYSMLNKYLKKSGERIPKLYFSATLFVMEKMVIEGIEKEECLEKVLKSYKDIDDTEIISEAIDGMDFKSYVDNKEYFETAEIVKVDFAKKRRIK